MGFFTVRTVVSLVLFGLSSFSVVSSSPSLASTIVSKRCNSTCPEFGSGTFVVEQFQLYPENAKWDPVRCLVYFGALFNASVAVFDPYKMAVTDSILFPGLSGDPSLHLGPAAPDPSGKITVLFDAAAAFNTAGQDVSGSNILVKYDPDAKEVVWERNITALVTQGAFGGFQDVAHDRDQNIYVVGTYPGTVLRADKDGNALTGWFLPGGAALANTTVAGFAGIESIPLLDILLVNDISQGEIYRFDNVSTSETGTPTLVPRTDVNGSAPLGNTDAILLPPKYNNTVLLVAVDTVGVTVLRSRDGQWQSAETLGTISNNESEANGGAVPATVQVGPPTSGKIFAVEEFFADSPVVPGTNAGNRTAFPMIDITTQVDALLAQFP